ncbi:MAG: hypothetical protein ABI175_20530 [Polyangiales bacterium]
MRRVAASLGLALTLVACGYPAFDFVPDDASTDLDVAAPFDATVDSATYDASDTRGDDLAPVDSSIGDAADASADAGDTSPTDTASTDTARADTSVVVETSTGCVGSTAIFCEDWDKATGPKAGFDWTNLDPTTSLALEASGRSLPNALVASTAPGDASVVTADLGKNFLAPAADSVLRVDAWIKLEKLVFPTSTGGAFLFKVERGGAGSVGDGVTFSIDDKGFYVDRIGLTYGFYAIAYKPAADTWAHVRMDVKLHTASGTITVWIDDMVTPRLTDSAISTVRADTTSRNFIVGLYAQSSTGAFRARYDDVSIGVSPVSP